MKNILIRFFKVINILVNIIMGFLGGFYAVVKLFDGYNYEKDLFTIIIYLIGFFVINFADGFIRTKIEKF